MFTVKMMEGMLIFYCCWTWYEYSPDTGGGCLFSYIVPRADTGSGGNVGLFISQRIMIGLVYEPKAPMMLLHYRYLQTHPELLLVG